MSTQFKILLLILILVFGAAGFLFFSTKGGIFVTKLALSHYSLDNNVTISDAEGNLIEGLFFDELAFTGLDKLPKKSVLKVQELGIRLTALHKNGLTVNILNGRLELPNFEEPILIFGVIDRGVFDLNIYAKNVNVREVLKRFTLPILRKLSGDIDIDLFLKGKPREFVITGDFFIKKLSYKYSVLKDTPGFINLKVNNARKKLKLNGLVELGEGVISGPRIATINVEKGELKFNDDPKNPALDFAGHAEVEKTKISIALRGTRLKPDLVLTSIPSIPQEWLLVMLGTGKNWGGINESVINEKLSPAIAKDFIDYLVFGGSGNKMANFLGIKEWSVLFDEQSKGFKLKKTISERINAIYGIEQSQSIEKTETESVQTLGGEYQVTDSVTLDAERRIKETSGRDVSDTQQPQEDSQIMLKYEKAF